MKVDIDFDQCIPHVKKSDFEKMTIVDMEIKDVLCLCDRIENKVSYPLFDSFCYIVKKDESTFQVQLTQMEKWKYWNNPIELHVYMKWKRERIQEMQNEGIPIFERSFHDYDDDDFVELDYFIDIKAKTGKEVLDELTRLIEVNIHDALQFRLYNLLRFGK